MPDAVRSRPLAVWALMALLVVQGLSGIGGGIGLVRDPTGAALGIPQSWLAGSPFADYLVPGLFLTLILGVIPLGVALGVWRGRGWSRLSSLAIGIVLVVWIAVQVAIIGYRSDPPLQAIYGSLGVAIAGLALTPAVRRHLDGTV